MGQEAERGRQEGASDEIPLRTIPSDPFPLSRLHLLESPDFPKIVPAVGYLSF
jgi:hypothetical protein